VGTLQIGIKALVSTLDLYGPETELEDTLSGREDQLQNQEYID